VNIAKQCSFLFQYCHERDRPPSVLTFIGSRKPYALKSICMHKMRSIHTIDITTLYQLTPSELHQHSPFCRLPLHLFRFLCHKPRTLSPLHEDLLIRHHHPPINGSAKIAAKFSIVSVQDPATSSSSASGHGACAPVRSAVVSSRETWYCEYMTRSLCAVGTLSKMAGCD
jgi:hypothetical protein